MNQDKDIAPLMNEIEPGLIDKETEINFTDLFEAQSKGFSEEDMEYLLKEYGVLIYKEIPDTAFESTSDKAKVNGEELKADKITMHRSEEHTSELQSRGHLVCRLLLEQQ